MDGYAVVAAACAGGAGQWLVGEQPAGIDRRLRIKPGETVRVFTGAPIPAGADAVVMQEDVRSEGSEIFVNTNVEPGEFIRRAGCDLSEGQKIVEAGTRLRPQTLALLASQGFAEIEIGSEVRVAIVSTGDELVAPGGIVRSRTNFRQQFGPVARASGKMRRVGERCSALSGRPAIHRECISPRTRLRRSHHSRRRLGRGARFGEACFERGGRADRTLAGPG